MNEIQPTSPLHQEPATPGFDYDMSLLDSTPEEEAAAREHSLRTDYITGTIEDQYRTPDEVESWFAGLTPEEQEVVLAEQAHYQEQLAEVQGVYDAVKHEITGTAPELLAGRLPDHLAEKLGGSEYFLGTNQMMASTAQEAADYLALNGGIGLAGYDLSGRALWVDDHTNPDFVEHAVVEGYTHDPSIGRFILALPHEPLSPGYSIDQTMKEMRIEGKLPSDYITGEDQSKAINQKYCAGFIDGTGQFHENPSFMQDQPIPEITAEYDEFL